jgi:hypothetical protein
MMIWAISSSAVSGSPESQLRVQSISARTAPPSGASERRSSVSRSCMAVRARAPPA